MFFGKQGMPTAATQSFSIPAPPSVNQNTWIDSVIINAISATGGGASQVCCTLTVAIALQSVGTGSTNFILATPIVSAAGQNTTAVFNFPGGLQVNNVNGTASVSFFAQPASAFGLMDVQTSFHYS